MLTRTGRGLDDDGYILPEVSLARVTAPYHAVVAEVRDRCAQAFGGRLHSLYLCGSIVKGTAVPYVSDLDGLAILRATPEADDHDMSRAVARDVERRHALLSETTLGLAWVEDILSERERFDMGFCVKCLCACILGEDLASSLPAYRPSIALARETNGNIRQAIDDRRERLMRAKEPATLKRLCRGIMRKMIRTGFTLVMPRYGGWTSDLDPCVEIFGQYYTEQRAAMDVALTLARAPSADRAKVLAILDGLGTWLVQEYDRVILNTA